VDVGVPESEYHGPMNVLVVGAGSRTGRLLVEGAVERGHVVTALAHSSVALGDLDRGVRLVPGDVRDGGAVSDAVDGCSAVLLALADATGGSDWADAAEGTANVVRSMRRYSVRRLVALSAATAAPVGEAGHPGFFARFGDPAARAGAVAALRRMEVTIRQSQLDWTLVRAARLGDGAARSRVRSGPGYVLPGARRIARADVAGFMLEELERTGNVAHAVAIAT